MEKSYRQDYPLGKVLIPIGVTIILAITIILIAYGPESVAPWAHDFFHDIRHALGIPCH